jgi:hypothetical protein
MPQPCAMQTMAFNTDSNFTNVAHSKPNANLGLLHVEILHGLEILHLPIKSECHSLELRIWGCS